MGKAKDKDNIRKFLQALSTGQIKTTWSDSIDELIKHLTKKRKLKDRLDHAELMMEILNAMTFSLNGWYQWGNVYRLNRLTEEEYKEFVPKLLEIAVKWLELDKELTGKKEKELKKNIGKQGQNSKTTYVS